MANDQWSYAEAFLALAELVQEVGYINRDAVESIQAETKSLAAHLRVPLEDVVFKCMTGIARDVANESDLNNQSEERLVN